jgi:hypothetical protein
MTRLTTVFGRSRRQNFFLTFSVFKASLLSRREVSVCIADGCDMQTTTDDYRIRSHGVVRRKQILRAQLLETTERCSGMRGGAQNPSVRLKKSLVFSHPECDLPDTHSCEGARPAASGISMGKHFFAPQMNGENGVHSCASFACSRKHLLSHASSPHKKAKGISTLFCVVTFQPQLPIVFSPPSSVALHMAAGLGVRDVGQYETSSHVQEILALRPSVSIYPSAVPYFSGSFGPTSRRRNPRSCVTSGAREMDQQEVDLSTGTPFLVRDPVADGDGCMKETDHPTRHRRVHPGVRANIWDSRGYAWRGSQFGRGQNTVLGWSDPTFGSLWLPKRILGRSSPLASCSPCFARVH